MSEPRTRNRCDAIYHMTVSQLTKLLDSPSISLIYRRDKALNLPVLKSKDIYKRHKPRLAGLDVYICKCTGSKRPEPVMRAGKRGGTLPRNCKARFTIKYPAGYSHTDEKKINVEEHGNMVVKMSWFRTHSHEVDADFIKNLPLSGAARDLLRLAAEADMKWSDVERHRSDAYLSNPYERVFMEIFKTQRYNLAYQRRKLNTSKVVLGDSILSSLKSWVDNVHSDGGIGLVTNMFYSLDGSHTLQEFETTEKRKVWSFMMMTKWQMITLKLNHKVIHLDGTHDICWWSVPEEKAVMFSILVKNQATGTYAPVAFMFTNSGIAPVIAHFVKWVKGLLALYPNQIVTDSDQAKVNAIISVWGEYAPIVYCRAHVLEAFKLNLSKIDGSSCAFEEVGFFQNEALNDFTDILNSATIAEGDENIERFLNKYNRFEAFLSCVQRQWFCDKQYIIAGWRPRYVPAQNTNNFIESFLEKLKETDLKDVSNLRADAIVLTIVNRLEPNYAANEAMVWHGFAQRVMDEGEKEAFDQAALVSEDKLKEMIKEPDEGMFVVNSFTAEYPEHYVDMYPGRFFTGRDFSTRPYSPSCTCPANVNSSSKCKHVCMVERCLKVKGNPAKGAKSAQRGGNGNMGVPLMETPFIAQEPIDHDHHDHHDHHDPCDAPNHYTEVQETPMEQGSNPSLNNGTLSFITGDIAPTKHNATSEMMVHANNRCPSIAVAQSGTFSRDNFEVSHVLERMREKTNVGPLISNGGPFLDPRMSQTNLNVGNTVPMHPNISNHVYYPVGAREVDISAEKGLARIAYVERVNDQMKILDGYWLDIRKKLKEKSLQEKERFYAKHVSRWESISLEFDGPGTTQEG